VFERRPRRRRARSWATGYCGAAGVDGSGREARADGGGSSDDPDAADTGARLRTPNSTNVSDNLSIEGNLRCHPAGVRIRMRSVDNDSIRRGLAAAGLFATGYALGYAHGFGSALRPRIWDSKRAERSHDSSHD
jgi:hypothetical protein